jgi:Response regulator receiver domain
MKILYVEHDNDNLYMLKRRLERSGNFEVCAAEDCERGYKLALTEHPDVILMDLEMPVMDRWEPVRSLKKGRFLLRRKPRIGFDPIGAGSAEPGFCGGNRRGVALTGLHVQPRLAVGDMSARQAVDSFL